MAHGLMEEEGKPVAGDIVDGGKDSHLSAADVLFSYFLTSFHHIVHEVCLVWKQMVEKVLNLNVLVNSHGPKIPIPSQVMALLLVGGEDEKKVAD